MHKWSWHTTACTKLVGSWTCHDCSRAPPSAIWLSSENDAQDWFDIQITRHTYGLTHCILMAEHNRLALTSSAAQLREKSHVPFTSLLWFSYCTEQMDKQTGGWLCTDRWRRPFSCLPLLLSALPERKSNQEKQMFQSRGREINLSLLSSFITRKTWG